MVMSKKKVLIGAITLVFIVATIGFSYSLGKNSNKNQGQSVANKQEIEKYNLLAKRIFIDDPNDTQINFTSLRNQIKDYYSRNNLSGSIYFEYLPTGTSIRIDGDQQEIAASLVKLPAAMELYKNAELGNIDLNQKVTLSENLLDSGYGDLYKRGPGYSLSLKDAVQIMLEKSDNTALKVVATSIAGKLPIEQTPLTYADVDFVQNRDMTISLSARSYGSLLKCLYFACYNSKDDSQKILEDLTKSPFNDRLIAGITDKKIVVAHKTGNHTSDRQTQSDCGIVYYPKRNYLICVMIKGTDTPDVDAKIADISKMSYDYINSLKR